MKAIILLLLLTFSSFGPLHCEGTNQEVGSNLEGKELKQYLRAQKKIKRAEKKAARAARKAKKAERAALKAAKKAEKAAKKAAKKAAEEGEEGAGGITVTVGPRLTDTGTTTPPPATTTPPPATTTLRGAAQGNSCDFPTVKVQGNILVLNDDSDRRFFLAGMVDNLPSYGKQLHLYDHDEMEQIMLDHKRIGANAMRWNAFLKGGDITWDNEGYVTGLLPGCMEALKDGLDLGKKHGILVQIVLSTSHFLRYGDGGIDGHLKSHGVYTKNKMRVDNNFKMFTTLEGTQAYINNVIKPMSKEIGLHPALFGFVIVNEGNGMTILEGSDHGIWSDVQVQYAQLLRWVNMVAGELNRQLPGVILSAPIIARLSSWWEDKNLIDAGGDKDGVLHIFQHQYYPKFHPWSYSPFRMSATEMGRTWRISDKPSIVGEFPIEGLERTQRNNLPMTLFQAYSNLYQGGHSGGFTWNHEVYTKMSDDEKKVVDQAYMDVDDQLLNGLSLADMNCDWGK